MGLYGVLPLVFILGGVGALEALKERAAGPMRVGLQGLDIDLDDLAYFLGRETILVTRKEGMALWREKLFALMARDAVRPISYFRLPPERVVELGVQVEM